MSRAWLRQSERGSPFLIRLIAAITRRLGRPAGRVLLYPITFYFVLFSGKARRASTAFLARVLPHTPRFRDNFRHYHTFAATILDRVHLLSGRFDHFEVEIHGEAELLTVLKRGRGCVMLGSHLGSFEVLRALAEGQEQIDVHPLMYVDNADKINDVLNALNPELAARVIPIGRPDSLMRAQDVIDRGASIGILGDRVGLDNKTVDCRFFGESARFPAGPMLVADLLGAPVVLFFGLYLGGRRYRIHLEVLHEGTRFARDQRWPEIQTWTQRYAERLEHHARQAPYNWFNFYDFWERGDA